ncbi:hypothetical protein QE152_g7880 [Popillia japonica]|uniref:Uncharacterized protein n=1 Tax=Popillia japonica TaxID=7064 RepID=A0AAW1MDH4_POPJA
MGELEAFLRERDVQIALICETRLSARQHLRLRGFTVVEKRGANQHGGVAILVRNDTPYKQLAMDGPEWNDVGGANQHGGVAILVRNDTPYKQLAMDGPEWNDVEAVAIQLADNTAIVFTIAPVENWNSASWICYSQERERRWWLPISMPVTPLGDATATTRANAHPTQREHPLDDRPGAREECPFMQSSRANAHPTQREHPLDDRPGAREECTARGRRGDRGPVVCSIYRCCSPSARFGAVAWEGSPTTTARRTGGGSGRKSAEDGP